MPLWNIVGAVKNTAVNINKHNVSCLCFVQCLAAFTFTFTASALGSVGHCSGVWAGIQNQQLLWHGVVITTCQRGVWRYKRAQRGLFVRIRKSESNRSRDVARTRLTETDSNCNLLKINTSSRWHKVLLLVTIASQVTCLQLSPQGKTGNYSVAATEPLSPFRCHSLCRQPPRYTLHFAKVCLETIKIRN